MGGDNMIGEDSADAFGSSISLSADSCVVAVGAPLNDNSGAAPNNSNATTTFSFSGQVRIFRLNMDSGNWVLDGVVYGGEFGALLGRSVSLSSDGRTLAAGASSGDGSGFDSGFVRIYKSVAR